MAGVRRDPLAHAVERVTGVVEAALAVEPDRLLAGTLGEQAGRRPDRPRRPAPGRRSRRGPRRSTRARPGRARGSPTRTARSRSVTRTSTPTSRPTSPKSNATRRAIVRTWPQTMSPRRIRARPPDCSTRNGDSESTRTDLGQDQLEDDLAGHDLEGLPHLGRDVVAHLVDVAGEVEVAAAVVGHRLEQRLVEVDADPERAGRHPAPPEVEGEAAELLAVGDADVGEAVGEQQDAVDALLREARRDLLAAGQPARMEVGAAAGLDGGELAAGPLAGARRRVASPGVTTSTRSS